MESLLVFLVTLYPLLTPEVQEIRVNFEQPTTLSAGSPVFIEDNLVGEVTAVSEDKTLVNLGVYGQELNTGYKALATHVMVGRRQSVVELFPGQEQFKSDIIGYSSIEKLWN